MQGIMKSRFGLVVVFIAFVVCLVASSILLKGVRVDLTENGLYTLSDGTRKVLSELDADIKLTLFYSDKATAELPALRTYANRVEELLREFESFSNGKLHLKIVDPEPFSEEEDEAAAAGLQGVPAGLRGDEIYFGLVGRRSAAVGSEGEAEDETGSEEARSESDVEEVIPFFQLDKEEFLEYELAKLVYSLAHPEPPVVGIISGLKLNGGINPVSRQNEPAWVIVQQLEGLFELNWLEQDLNQIPAENVDILLVIHPKNLPDTTLLAIDQFVLSGGKAVMFVDPFAEADRPAMPMMGGGDQSSDAGPLLSSWGVEYDREKVVGDYKNSMVVSMGSNRKPVRHIGLLGLGADSFNQQDVVLSGLEMINFSSAGILSQKPGATTSFTPLVESSDEAMPLKAGLFQMLHSPDTLLDDFAPTGERYVMAARVTGPAQTAFPDGIEIEVESETGADADTAGDANTAGEKGADDSGDQGSKAASTPGKSSKKVMPGVTRSDDIQLIVVADTDVLSDRLWVQIRQFFQQRVISPWADNAGFLVSSIENLSGNSDLISIRSRGRFSRPFTKVESIRLQAEEKFLEQQRELQERLRQTEKKLAELEGNRGVEEQSLLSPEQEKTLVEFQKEKLKIRKDLRDVQHQLDQDIEKLGSNLKLINILLVPFLLTVIVLGIRYFRGKARYS
ncbi:MAG: ABC transporter [Gammaproteobacteria bacterium]|nr:MAG: ABC transporter [Pseudomonadota bacterium]PIE38547.1 MAG: ABC transporter [Gammaproteobacteria bacterium]